MTDFDDIEPEDSWDPDDDVHVLVDNLFRRLVLLGIERLPNDYYDDDDVPLHERVDELHELVERARARLDLTTRDLVRIEHTDADLAHIETRLS